MRKIIRGYIFLCFGLSLPLAGVAHASGDRILDLTIENSTGTYIVTVTRVHMEQTLEVTLDTSGSRTVIAHYSSGGFVYAKPKYPKMDRLITLWQPGVALTTVIFRLAPLSGEPEIAFNDSSEIEPDFINGSLGGDFMLLHLGKHFVRAGVWVPADTAVYIWDGRRYRLARTVRYEERFDAVAKLDRPRPSTNQPK
jgi:hypothetical protein